MHSEIYLVVTVYVYPGTLQHYSGKDRLWYVNKHRRHLSVASPTVLRTIRRLSRAIHKTQESLSQGTR